MNLSTIVCLVRVQGKRKSDQGERTSASRAKETVASATNSTVNFVWAYRFYSLEKVTATAQRKCIRSSDAIKNGSRGELTPKPRSNQNHAYPRLILIHEHLPLTLLQAQDREYSWLLYLR
jgi:hypothetical protein